MSDLTHGVPVQRPARFRKIASRCFIVFLFALLIASICLVRTDYFVHRVATESVLTWEVLSKSELGLIKGILGIDMKADAPSLIAAVEKGDAETVGILLRAGLDPDAKTEDGVPALVLAAEKGSVNVINEFIVRNANLEPEAPFGLTPLLAAIKKNKVEVARRLLFAGADPNHSDAEGNTPLHIAAEQQNDEIAEALLVKGANANIRNKAGRTPLYAAAEQRNVRLVRALIDGGVNPNTVDGEKQTALVYAEQTGNREIIDLLRDRMGLPPIADEKAPVAEQAQEMAPTVSRANTSTPTIPQGPKLTRVRGLGEPAAIWSARSGRMTLDSIRAPVRNVGDVTAEGVVVTVKIPGGKVVTLSGPTTLKRNQRADYTMANGRGESVPFVGRLQADATCSNCHK